MDWTFLLLLAGAIGIAFGVIFVAARFSPDGTAALRHWKFWSLPIGTITPGLIVVGSLIAYPENSDHPGLAAVLMLSFLGALFFASSLVSLFLKRPAGGGWRFALGLGCNIIIVLWLWIADM